MGLLLVNCLVNALVIVTLVGGSIDLLFIGTGAGGASKLRGASSLALRLQDGEVWLFDCGEGTALKMNDVYVRPSKIGAIFVTHLHGDHVWGLAGVLCSNWNSNDTVHKRGKAGFHIFGPRGIRKMIRQQMLLSRSLCMFHFTIHELIPKESQYDTKEEHDYYKTIETADGPLHPQEILGRDIEAQTGPDGNPVWNLVNDTRGSLVAGMITHRLPTFGFTFHESSGIPNLNRNLLQDKYNLTPGVEYGMLQRGFPVHLPNNITIHPSEVIVKATSGRKVTILGDTSNPWAMYDIAKNSDVLVHEATHFRHQREAAEFYGHSTPTQAVRFAKGINAKLVVLTHISQRVVSRPASGGRSFNKTIFTADDVMNEAVDELFKFRFKNLSIVIADDGTTLKLEKRTNQTAGRPWFYLLRSKKTPVSQRTVYEAIPPHHQRPPPGFNHRFKVATFLPPLNLMTNFSRLKFVKYYGAEVGLAGERVLRTNKPFYKNIRDNTVRWMNASFLNIHENRTFINLEPHHLNLRNSRSEMFFNRTFSLYYFNRYGGNVTE